MEQKHYQMKKFIFPVFFLMLVFGYQTMQAQGDTKITTGVVAYNQQDFAKALKALNTGLSDISQLKSKNVPKGFYYRGMSRLGYMRTLAGKVQGGSELSEAEESAMNTIVIDAYQDFQNAKKHDDGKWGKKVDQQMSVMGTMILQGGLTLLNGTYDDQMTKAEKQEAYAEVVKYMKLAEESMPTNYMVYDLRGQAELNLSDSLAALKDFQMAAKVFEENEPKRPDQLIAYVFYRTALIQRYNSEAKDLDGALAALDKGKEMLKKENKRMLANKDSYTADQVNAINKQFENAKQDLDKFELDILLNSPGKLQQAIDKFDQATANEPNNYILHVAYAQLLEQVDMVKAEEMYKTASRIDDTKHIAFFNLGALYVNKAVEKYKEANKEEKDFDKAKALQDEGDRLYAKAFPYLTKAQEIEGCDRPTLDAIKNICINLSSSDDEAEAAKFTEAYKKYKDIGAECGH